MCVSFVSFPIMTRLFTVEDYGNLALVNTTLAIMVALAKNGITTSFIRHYHEFNSHYERKNLYSSALGGSIFISITIITVYSLILFFMRDSISSSLMKIFLITGLIILSSNVQYIFIGFYRAEEKVLTLNIVNLVYKAGSLATGLLVSILLIKGLYGYFAGVIVFEILMISLIGLTFYRKRVLSVGAMAPGTFKKLFYYGLPLTSFELSSLANDFSDRFLIKYFLGSSQLGIYSAGYNLSLYVKDFLTRPMWLAIFPIYTKLWEQDGREKTEVFLSKLLKYYFCLGILLAFGVSLLSMDLISVLATKKYAAASQIVPFVVGGAIIYGSTLILNAGFYLFKETKQMAVYTLIAAGTNFLLNLYLIPKYNIMGAAYSSAASYLLLTILLKRGSDKFIKIKLPVKDLFFYLSFAILMALILNKINYDRHIVNLILKPLYGFLIYSICVLLYDYEVRRTFFSYVRKAINRS